MNVCISALLLMVSSAMGQKASGCGLASLANEAPTPADGMNLLQLAVWGDPDVTDESCTLPEGARWCKVKLGLKHGDFDMAVYGDDDIVSASVCNRGTWELSPDDVKEIGQPGHALDIGANLGFYSLVLAAAGWSVTAFEPMPKNTALIHASLCRNPQMKSKVTLLEFGLGAKNDHCIVVSGDDNVGDGMLKCGKDATQPPPVGYQVRAQLEIQRLDDVLAKENITHIDFMKMDVEGFECQVIAGAQNLLASVRPRLIQSEVWPLSAGGLAGCTHKAYFSSFLKANYQIAKDMQCQVPDQSAPTNIVNRFMCATTTPSASTTAVSLLAKSAQWNQRSIVWFKAA